MRAYSSRGCLQKLVRDEVGQGTRVNGDSTVDGRPSGRIGDGCPTLACQVNISCGAAGQIALTFSHILMCIMVTISRSTGTLSHAEGAGSRAVASPYRHGCSPMVVVMMMVVERIGRGLTAPNNHLPIPFIGNQPLASAASGCITAISNQSDRIGNDAKVNSGTRVVTADASKRHAFAATLATG